MNLAIRGIEGQIAHGDTFHNDRHPDLKADFILANPPFNVSDWRGELLRDDPRWQYGVPPAGNANFAWVQHLERHGQLIPGIHTSRFRSFATGALIDSLKCADIPKVTLRIPPLREQRAIAHILGSLDDKIELNHGTSSLACCCFPFLNFRNSCWRALNPQATGRVGYQPRSC